MTILDKVTALLGEGAVLEAGTDRVPRIAPGSPDAIALLLGTAHQEGWRVRVEGAGSWLPSDAPADLALTTRRLDRVPAVEPQDLTATAEAGIGLDQLRQQLADRGAWLAIDPPGLAGRTLGSIVATATAGPLRQGFGPVKDHLLGVTFVTGDGRMVQSGGRVMKNVAGYDVSRLVAGSLGKLGVIAEASLKVLPRPPAQRTLRFDMDQPAALDAMNVWAGEPLPISASAWHEGALHLRLSGSAAAVQAAAPRLGGTELADDAALWRAIREQTHAFFGGEGPLWRIAVPSTAAPLALSGAQLLEWNGGLRWLRSSAGAQEIRAAAKRAGGHATLFRARDKSSGVFTPLDPVLLRLHRGLKSAFDPAGILNPGRMYAEF